MSIRTLGYGLTGAAGPKGDTGAKGDTGNQGSQGAAGAKGDTGAQGVPGTAGAQGSQGVAGNNGTNGAAGATGPAGSANNVQFTGSVTLGSIVAIGAVTKNITVTGVLSTDALNIMAGADMPAGVIFAGGRVTANDSVRLYFNALSILTNNTPISMIITALR